MEDQGFPSAVVEAIKDSVDCNIYFFGDRVELGTMYIIVIAAILIAIALYVAMNVLKTKKR